MDKSEIQKQAKQLLDKFAKSLEEIEKKPSPDFYVEREEFEREEKLKTKNKKIKETPDTSDFKKRILENAPNSNEDFILTEKGNWK